MHEFALEGPKESRMNPSKQTPSLEELVKQQYEENQRKAAGEAAGGEAPPPAGDFKMNIAGQDYTFKSVEEMQNFMNSALTASQQAAAQTIEEVKRTLPGTRMTTEEAHRETPKPDLKEFARRLDENPADAFNYIDKFRYGTEDVPGLIRQMAAQQVAQGQMLAAYQFRDMHPEFNRTPENAEALSRVLQSYQLPLNYDGLEMAYAVAKQQGFIKTSEAEEEPPSWKSEPAPPVRSAPPRAGRASAAGTSPDYMSMAEDLDADQLLQVISKLDGGR